MDAHGRRLPRSSFCAPLCWDSPPGGFHENVSFRRALRIVDFFPVHSRQSMLTQRIPLFIALHRREHPRAIMAMTGGNVKILERTPPLGLTSGKPGKLAGRLQGRPTRCTLTSTTVINRLRWLRSS